MSAAAAATKRAALHEALRPWYRAHARDLPWRRIRDPYRVWLSEVMLQQTRVDTVIGYYERFLARFPGADALANAPLEEVLSVWSGLGYYHRARALHRTACVVRDVHGGAFPASVAALRELPGIGDYTAGAIASIAFDAPAALVDGNVARVLSRLFALDADVRSSRGLAALWKLADALVPREAPGEWNQALMELGATVCTPVEPACVVCPVRGSCEARAQGRERALPNVRPKKAPLVERRVAIVASDNERVLLAQRHAAGVFAGMWEPPSRSLSHEENDADAARGFASVLGVRGALSRAAPVRHTLSHRRLEVAVFVGRFSKLRAGVVPDGYERLEAATIAELGDRALTTYARKVLAALPPRSPPLLLSRAR